MKKIKFNLVDSLDYANIPLPAKKYIPEWYKKIMPFKSDIKKSEGSLLKSITKNKSVKKCVPFMDSFTTGYILETWCDLEVISAYDENGNEDFELNWIDMEWTPIQERPQIEELVVPEGYYKRKVSLQTPFFIKTPPGYSVIISQPYNRYDLPFLALTGIVDTDIHPMFPGNLPIFVKKGFTGIIPKGTPLIQILPFKRDSWLSIRDEKIKKEGLISKKMGLSVATDWYRNHAWSKKSYE
jgi:hypothetical protein